MIIINPLDMCILGFSIVEKVLLTSGSQNPGVTHVMQLITVYRSSDKQTVDFYLAVK